MKLVESLKKKWNNIGVRFHCPYCSEGIKDIGAFWMNEVQVKNCPHCEEEYLLDAWLF